MRNRSADRRGRWLVFAPVEAVGWLLFALLGLAVRLALFREHRTQGITSVLWGLGFGLLLWFGALALGLHELRAIPFASIAGAGIALFVYTRGAALGNPPAEQPGVYLRRLLARRRSARAARIRYQPSMTKTRELQQARIALADRDHSRALYLLREAERVAVAQRKLEELLEVSELIRALSTQSAGRTRNSSEHLAQKASEHLHEFPSEALASAGVRIEPERKPINFPTMLQELRALPAAQAPATTRELSQARLALNGGEFATALYLLREARRVAVAQRKLAELLTVYELAQALSQRSSGRTRAASERLASKVEVGLHEFAQPGALSAPDHESVVVGWSYPAPN